MSKNNLIDLSHTVSDGLITYQGLPAPIICDFLSREESRNYYDEGTGISHRQNRNGGEHRNLSRFAFSPLRGRRGFVRTTVGEISRFGRGLLFARPIAKNTAVDFSLFENLDVRDKAVLINTNWSRHWETENYFSNHPFLTAEIANFLVENKARLVGIDSYNIDDTNDKARPVHTILLGAGIPIVEHLWQSASFAGSKFQILRRAGQSQKLRHISGQSVRRCELIKL